MKPLICDGCATEHARLPDALPKGWWHHKRAEGGASVLLCATCSPEATRTGVVPSPRPAVRSASMDEILDALARRTEPLTPELLQAFVDVARASQRLVEGGWKVPALREALKKLEEEAAKT